MFSGFGWVWMDAEGNIRLLGSSNKLHRLLPLTEIEALIWAMQCHSHQPHQSLGGLQGHCVDDNHPQN